MFLVRLHIHKFLPFTISSVDWSRGSKTLNYIAARNRALLVGKFVGEFIDFLDEQKAIKFNDLTVVGFSLGGLQI